ncbi:ParB N-terminal domain-containing protein [Paraburkholderia hospita]|uniref:ParB N-terminal domain-containing protein n=1 Tax=Paraburkholderia hospita TaxID=169430 RepID=UPI0008A7A869|nr:ParB N-terminal domain-containing protein [Paraburkholderia hospita]SEI14343.1 hypothetical protein SAMN05192544_102512 [Paraburkholderia hospita]
MTTILIKCRKPHYYLQEGQWELDNENGESPVIAILDPQKVRAALNGKGERFAPSHDRIEKLMIKIRENGYLELPEVRDGSYGGIAFCQGRHRTTALANLGFSAYPVVTTDEDAPSLLEKFGASVDDAREHFDWTDILDYPVVGL